MKNVTRFHEAISFCLNHPYCDGKRYKKTVFDMLIWIYGADHHFTWKEIMECIYIYQGNYYNYVANPAKWRSVGNGVMHGPASAQIGSFRTATKADSRYFVPVYPLNAICNSRKHASYYKMMNV